MQYSTEQLYTQLFRDIHIGTIEEKEVFKSIIEEYLCHDDIRHLFNIKHHNTNRLMHSLHVSYRCFITSYRHGLDYRSMAIGGLLHDFCLDKKGEYPKEKITDIWCLYHPQQALTESLKRFELSEISKDIISVHMFPVVFSLPKYKETFLIIYWDKHCAVREVMLPILGGYKKCINQLD